MEFQYGRQLLMDDMLELWIHIYKRTINISFHSSFFWLLSSLFLWYHISSIPLLDSLLFYYCHYMVFSLSYILWNTLHDCKDPLLSQVSEKDNLILTISIMMLPLSLNAILYTCVSIKSILLSVFDLSLLQCVHHHWLVSEWHWLGIIYFCSVCIINPFVCFGNWQGPFS